MEKIEDWYGWYLSERGVSHYAINSLLFLTTAREKYAKMYERSAEDVLSSNKEFYQKVIYLFLS